MRKLIGLISGTCLALALTALPANATCYSLNGQSIPGIGAVTGQVCLTSTSASLLAAVTTAAGTFDVVANGAIRGTTLTGTVVIYKNGVVVERKTFKVSSPVSYLTALEFFDKALALIPQK